MKRTTRCPKCGELLEATGEVGLVGQAAAPVFQCARCVVLASFAGERVEVALTFCLDERGRPVDPATGGLIGTN